MYRFDIGSLRRSGLALWCIIAGLFAAVAPAAADPCEPGSNPIVCENSKPGTPSNEWDIGRNGDLSIQGFSTDMSVNVGESIGFKVDTDASDYALLIYRMGWYGGDGARLVDTLAPSARLPQTQPDCLTEAASHLLDCGNWGLSATWNVPADAVSGVYIARLRRPDTGGDSHVVFVVRDDARSSDVLFQTSDTTWQAYNNYGDRSMYYGGPNGRAYKASYNRPMFARGNTPDGRDSFFGSEYAMIRWLERNGYDVSYVSGVDTDRAEPSQFLDHDVFLSVGHDEYWSGRQRATIEAARDAGVNLIFASGNEVYWKTRWEPSIDGSDTDHRTLVSYKETKSGAKIDPSPEWTGTWRDPRFSPPADGGRPENELTGTFFTVNCCTYSLKVPAEYGDLRFWRDTRVASLIPGTEATFPLGTLGYEWDEDLDNGFRPPGAFRMSRTTETVPERLIDYGQTVAVEEATHHLMMYRAASGALVFGAGTVQWSWGLDDYHDGLEAPVDPAMQQATVNVLADMGVQPASLATGLIAASASTDARAPSVSIESPGESAAFRHGERVTLSGSAIDSGGGVVAAVEVSLDGGSRWHPADGRRSWSYTGSPLARGTQTFMVRAVDDSGNLGEPASIDVDIGCPCTLFGDGPLPRVDAFRTTSPLELGVRFESAIDGYVAGVRFYKSGIDTGTHTGSLWSTDGTRLATGTFTDESETGWQELVFPQPVAITADTVYVASYLATAGYTAEADRFAVQPVSSPPLRAPASSAAAANGVFAVDSRFPDQSFGDTNYWVDVVFSDVALPDTNPPSVIAIAPLDGTSSVAIDTLITVTADEAIDATDLSVELVTGDGRAVAGSLAYDAETLSVTFTPSAPLASNENYTVSASLSDLAGNTMATPAVASFRTSQPDGAVPALWNDSDVPTIIAANDTSSIELGMKFVAREELDITGVRFYKSATNTGTHKGSLWSESGDLLGRVTFGDETRAGWQQASFAEPIRIAQGTTYVISYLAPEGHYSATGGYFDRAHDSGPLSAPASASVGGNGVYAYGGGGFPTQSSNRTNYWVTPVYERLPDTRGPTLLSSVPADGASSVALNTDISVRFDEPVQRSSIDIRVISNSGAEVSGSLEYDAASTTATFTPAAPLALGSGHRVEVSATDLIGNTTAEPASFDFRTRRPDGSVAALWNDGDRPAIADAGDSAAVELGMKFVTARPVAITGVRFYKSVANSGVHTGSLWSASGTLLARLRFTGESSAGWQQGTFATSVTIEPGQTYVVSYHAPEGHYSATPEFFNRSLTKGPLTAPSAASVGGNGVYAYGNGGFPSRSSRRTNYWVSAVYEDLPDTTPPEPVATTPGGGASSVALDTEVSVLFDEPVNTSSISMTLTDGDGTRVPGSVTSEDDARRVLYETDDALAPGTRYRVAISASDTAGNALSTPLRFTFRTHEPAGAVNALWDDAERPDVEDSGDANAIEVGTKFVADQDLDITGIRFYKAATNTGVHVGSLWDATGALLGRVTFAGESASGWQQAMFATPVRILRGQRYVVSYHAPEGHYSATGNYFEQARSNGPLTALASSASGGNGVYEYGSSGFPSSSFNQTSYWVTPVYEKVSAPADAGTGLWDYSAVPDIVDTRDDNSIEVGVSFVADRDLDIVGLRFYKSAANTGLHIGSLWDVSGALLAQLTFDNETSTGWQEARFADPVRIYAGDTHVASYLAPEGRYSATGRYFERAFTNGPLSAPASTAGGGNGLYRYGDGGFPLFSYNKTNYWITPIYELP